MSDERYSDIEVGHIHEIDNDKMETEFVVEMRCVIADMIKVPDSPDDMDSQMTMLVMSIEATTADGKEHTIVLDEPAMRMLYGACHEYKDLYMQGHGNSRPPSGIKDILTNLLKIVDDLEEGGNKDS